MPRQQSSTSGSSSRRANPTSSSSRSRRSAGARSSFGGGSSSRRDTNNNYYGDSRYNDERFGNGSHSDTRMRGESMNRHTGRSQFYNDIDTPQTGRYSSSSRGAYNDSRRNLSDRSERGYDYDRDERDAYARSRQRRQERGNNFNENDIYDEDNRYWGADSDVGSMRSINTRGSRRGRQMSYYDDSYNRFNSNEDDDLYSENMDWNEYDDEGYRY